MLDLAKFGLHPWTVTLRHDVSIPLDPWTAMLFLAIACGMILAARHRPSYAIALLVASIPLALPRYVGQTTITIEKAALAGFIIGLVSIRPAWIILRTWPVRRILFAVAFGLVAIVLSLIHAEHHALVVREFLKLAEYGTIFATAALAFAIDPDERPIWRSLMITGSIVCVSALAQYVVGANAGIFIHGSGVPRIAGLLEGPNQLSGYLGLLLPVLLARNLLHRDGGLAACIALLAVTDVLTLSRAGIVGALVACGVVFAVLRPPRVIGMRAITAGAVIGAIVVALAIRAGFNQSYFSLNPVPQPADHLGNRAVLWNAAITMWKHSPLIGVGAGNFEEDLAEVGAPGVHTHANSVYFQSLAEGGIVMFAATIAIFAAILTTLGRGGVRRPLVTGAFAATVGFALHQIFDDLVFFPKVGATWWLLVAIGVGELARRRLRSVHHVREVAA
jgi:O-antigen ligase